MTELIQQNIIDSSAEEARLFFMKQESFCNISLPRYFDFQKLLDATFQKLDERKFSNFKSITDATNPKNLSDVNYKFFQS
ncbi:MAG: hypothetical protein II752_08430, partial [Muribaculaceae bacterium]|nr:hypothetical protein [Muribaculaceae bacterium]